DPTAKNQVSWRVIKKGLSGCDSSEALSFHSISIDCRFDSWNPCGFFPKRRFHPILTHTIGLNEQHMRTQPILEVRHQNLQFSYAGLRARTLWMNHHHHCIKRSLPPDQPVFRPE